MPATATHDGSSGADGSTAEGQQLTGTGDQQDPGTSAPGSSAVTSPQTGSTGAPTATTTPGASETEQTQ
jgi:hypothetical protein